MRRRASHKACLLLVATLSLVLYLGTTSPPPARVRLSDLHRAHNISTVQRRPQRPVSQKFGKWNPVIRQTSVPRGECLEQPTVSSFAAILPTVVDLDNFASVLSTLKSRGHAVDVLITDHAYATSSPRVYKDAVLSFDVHQNVSDWLSSRPSIPNVVFTVDLLASHGDLAADPTQPWILISLPREELIHTQWMKSLSGKDWHNWHTPHVEITVITHSRPHSLSRLLRSLERSKFFGDRIDLRMNMEDSSDPQTMNIVDNYSWSHGSTFVHHRVIHGGLLAAVVESWYPHSNHTYGLLLEDDVELSPLWYAWVKMSILKYRYGEESVSPSVFGISLYQQKHLELISTGRQPFNVKHLFKSHGLLVPTTPYLSQIPCSWGAVYFPEHWREFHQYLSMRFSQPAVPPRGGRLSLDSHVVQNVRSNRWTKSWKRFFIEMVYLRGYVMLYPNYQDFLSLSTNHLEVGSHVKERTKAKEELFTLPLMSLSRSDSSLQLLVGLPNNKLPCLASLPVLNLTGAMVSGLHELFEVGRRRSVELFGVSEAQVL